MDNRVELILGISRMVEILSRNTKSRTIAITAKAVFILKHIGNDKASLALHNCSAVCFPHIYILIDG